MVAGRGIRTKLFPLGNAIRGSEIPTYYAWTSGTNTVYTQSETPNETYGEYVFSAPNELGSAITAHTSTTVTAGGITYTRNSASDNYTKVNSFYYTIDTTKYSSSYTTGYAPFTTGTYTSLVGETITIDWGDDSTTVITDGVISSSTNKHTYASAGEYNIRITSTGDFPAVNFVNGFGSVYTNLVTKVKSVIPKCKRTNGTDLRTLLNCFYSCLNLTVVPQNLFRYNTAVTDFNTCFITCEKLRIVPADLFKYNTAATNFGSCFQNCYRLAAIPADLFKYNTAATNFGSCFQNCYSSLTSIPADLFKYNTAATGFGNCFYGCTSLTSIPADLFKYNTVAIDFSECFRGCTSLTSIPTGLFDNNTAVTSFGNCFNSCSGLTSIPTGLFDNNTAVTSFSNCFSSCSGLTSIPADLFKYNTAVTNFFRCFDHCTGLTSIPQYLFKYNTAATNFSYCFLSCFKLQLNANIFCDEATEMATRFANVTPDFSNCFSRSSFTGTQGTAPQLWNYTYSGTPTSTLCFGGSGNSTTSLTNYSSIPSAWGGPA